MSKTEGTKIKIKFTEDLVGDRSGNQTAFTITGQQPQWVEFPSETLGPLVSLTAEVETTEGAPPIIYHEEDFSTGTLEDTEKLAAGIQLARQVI